MQNFNKFNDSDYISDAPDKLNDNFQTIASDFAGTSFPTTDLVEGMTCYRTDEGIEYRYVGGKWVDELGSAIKAKAFTKDDVIPITNGGISATTANGARTNLRTRIMSFDGFEKLGLDDTTVTLETLYQTFRNIQHTETNSGAMFLMCNIATNITTGLELPRNLSGTLFIKHFNDRTQLEFIADNGFIYTAKYETTSGLIGWKKIATQGALSMPSGNSIQISTSDSEQYYTAPADGWFCGRADADGVTFIALRNDTNGINSVVSAYSARTYVPASKGDTCHSTMNLNGAASGNPKVFFVYAQSEV